MIKTVLTILFGIVITLLISQSVMAVLQEVIVPSGQHVIVVSLAEHQSEIIAFTVAIGACIGLIILVACHHFFSSFRVRLLLIPGAILWGAIISGFYQANRLRHSTLLIDGETYGPAIQLQRLALDTIPWAGFITGLFIVCIMFWLGKRRENSDTFSPDSTAK